MFVDDVSRHGTREVVRAAAEWPKSAAWTNLGWFLEMIPRLPWSRPRLRGYVGSKRLGSA